MVASKKRTTKGRSSVRPSRSTRSEDPIVLVTEEHVGDLIEKSFRPLSEVEGEYGEWFEDYEPGRDRTLTEAVMQDGRAYLNTKYRYVYVQLLRPEDVAGLGNLDPEWISDENPESFMEELEDSKDVDILINPYREFSEVTDEELEYLGYSKAEIREARDAQRRGDPYPLYFMWKEVWDPRSTPVSVYPRLRELGVPEEYYHPERNRYRGSGRGSFSLGGKKTKTGAAKAAKPATKPKSRSPPAKAPAKNPAAKKTPAKKAPAKPKAQKIPGKKLRDGSIEVPEGAVKCLPDGTPLECDECGSGDCDLCVVEPTGSWRCRCWSCGNVFYEYPQK